jgi:hypothetical protein
MQISFTISDIQPLHGKEDGKNKIAATGIKI